MDFAALSKKLGIKTQADYLTEYVGPEIQALIATGDPITYEQYQSMAMNTYERYAIHPLLDTQALIRVTEYYISQSQRIHGHAGIPVTYDESVIHELAPLLIKRLHVLAGDPLNRKEDRCTMPTSLTDPLDPTPSPSL